MTKRSPNRKRKDSKPASSDDVKKIVSSWGGFEKLVADLSQTGDVTIDHNVILEGKSGAKRQIDVLLRHTQGLYDHLVILECKYWNKNVSRLHVDALITSVQEVNASKGVIFSTVGFQSGAVTQARASGIDLFTVRLPTNKEWGLPGRYIDFFLQFVEKSVSNISCVGSVAGQPMPPISMNLDFDEDGGSSSKTPVMTPVAELDKGYPKTFEEIVIKVINKAAVDAWKPQVIQDGGKWKRRFWCYVSFKPENQILVAKDDNSFLLVSEVKFDLGIGVSQSRFTFDRADKFSFVFAIDDKVKGITKSVSREKKDDYSIIGIVKEEPDDGTSGPVLENGSIMVIGFRSPVVFENFDHLARGEVSDVVEE